MGNCSHHQKYESIKVTGAIDWMIIALTPKTTPTLRSSSKCYRYIVSQLSRDTKSDRNATLLYGHVVKCMLNKLLQSRMEQSDLEVFELEAISVSTVSRFSS
jgi:hypothetical protein